MNPLLFTTPVQYKVKPTIPPQSSGLTSTKLDVKNDNYVLYTSKNEKFVSQILFADLGDCVKMYTVMDWVDPVTTEDIQKKNVELFITEVGGNT